MKKIIISKNYYILLFSLLSLFSCHYRSVKIKEYKTIRILYRADLQLVAQNNLKDPVFFKKKTSPKPELKPSYLVYNLKDEYQKIFLNNLRMELLSCNIGIISDSSSVKSDYTLVISNLDLTEDINPYTIHDSNSPDNFEGYTLSTCKIEAKGFLYKGEYEKMLDKVTVYLEKKEYVTNNQSFFEFIFGLNKDGKYYHKKSLSDNIFETLSQKAGYKIAGPITRLVRKNK